MTHEAAAVASPFKPRGRVAHSPLPLSTGMRRSKSAGDKFVFGARRRNLTPVSRQDISDGRQPGITSPRPNRVKRQNNSNYAIVDIGKEEFAAAYDKKETEDLQKFLFSRDRSKTVEEDIAQLMKLLFRKK